MATKRFYNLLATDDDDLTDDELLRKRWCEQLPTSVVSVLTARICEKQAEVMRIEKEIDELSDYLDGYFYLDKIKNSEGGSV